MASIHAFVVQPGAPEIGVCAKWWIEAFGDVLASTLQDEINRLEAFIADQARQVALMARCDGAPAGTCLLAQKELEPCHPVSLWLAGLYVTPEFRRRGVGGCWFAPLKITPANGATRNCTSTLMTP